MAGIAPLAPGYAEVLGAPLPGPGITSAAGALQTPHGRVATSWSVDARHVLPVDVTVPEGVTALLRLPGTADRVLGAGDHHATVDRRPGRSVRGAQ